MSAATLSLVEREPSDFQRDTVRELARMSEVGACGVAKACRAQKTVLAQPETFNEESAMSVADAASLALELT